MKIEMVNAKDLEGGVKMIGERYGASALILRSIETDDQEFLMIAHEASERKTASQEPNAGELEQVRQAIKSLPTTLSELESLLSVPFTQTQNRPASVPETPLNSAQTPTEKSFRALLTDLPISRAVRDALYRAIDRPRSKMELLAQLKTGLLNQLPEATSLNLDYRFHLLAGGHGVGKTAMALRLAAQLNACCNYKTSLVTLHAQNSAPPTAIDLGSQFSHLPMVFARSAEQLASIVATRPADEHYVIDLDADSLAELGTLQLLLRDIQCHLVIASDTSLPSLWAVENLATWSSVMVSRLDYSFTPWSALEALCKHRTPLSLGSEGSAHASGLVEVSTESLVNRLVGFVAEHLTEEIDNPTLTRQTHGNSTGFSAIH